MEISERLLKAEVLHHLVREPDLAGAATAIGVHLVDSVVRKRVRKVLGRLPLFGRDPLPDEDDVVRCLGCASPAEHLKGWICSRTQQAVEQCGKPAPAAHIQYLQSFESAPRRRLPKSRIKRRSRA